MDALEQVPLSAGAHAPISTAGEERPLFIADWIGALFLHYEIEPRVLQPFVPFELDMWKGRAFISLVAFTMRGMRFANGGVLGAWLCRPIATHEFLNLRTYVRHREDNGICFLTEWLPNRLSLLCGPLVYSLPYRRAAIRYGRQGGQLSGSVSTNSGCLSYQGNLCDADFTECAVGSLDQFLLERYIAFNAGHFTPSQPNVTRRRFRVWHEPWLQTPATVCVTEDTLLRRSASWWNHAHFVGANYSPGVRGVRMSVPRRMQTSASR